MKILFLTEFFPTEISGKISGGSESRTYYLAKELSKKHDVVVITSYLENSKRTELWGSLKIDRVGSKRNYLRKLGLFERGLFGLTSIIRIIREKPEIIDANNGVVYLFANIAARFCGAKLVYWVPDRVGLSEWKREQGLIGGIIAWAMEMTVVWFPADKIIALSKTTKNKIDKNNITVIYPGV